MSDNTDDMNDLVLLATARDEAVSKVKELEAKLAEQIEWVKRLADDLIAAEGREARLKEKLSESETLLAKATEALVMIADGPSEMVWGVDSEVREKMREMESIAGLTLAELKGEK